MQEAWYSFYLLYWYKSTNTDAEGAAAVKALLEVVESGGRNIEVATMKAGEVLKLWTDEEVDTYVTALEAEKAAAETAAVSIHLSLSCWASSSPPLLITRLYFTSFRSSTLLLADLLYSLQDTRLRGQRALLASLALPAPSCRLCMNKSLTSFESRVQTSGAAPPS